MKKMNILENIKHKITTTENQIIRSNIDISDG